MGENEVLENMILLEECGVDADKIINLFENYQDPNLKELGYLTFLNKIIQGITDSEMKHEEINSYIDNSMRNWTNYVGNIKLYDLNTNNSTKKLEKLEKLEKIIILKNSKIPRKRIHEIFKGYDDPLLSIYGYKNLVDNVITYISDNKVKGKEAVKYINEKFGEWGAERIGYTAAYQIK